MRVIHSTSTGKRYPTRSVQKKDRSKSRNRAGMKGYKARKREK